MDAQLQTCQSALENTRLAVQQTAQEVTAVEANNMAVTTAAKVTEQVNSLRLLLSEEISAQVKAALEQAMASLDGMKHEVASSIQQGIAEERENTRKSVADAVAQEKDTLSSLVAASIGEFEEQRKELQSKETEKLDQVFKDQHEQLQKMIDACRGDVEETLKASRADLADAFDRRVKAKEAADKASLAAVAACITSSQSALNALLQDANGQFTDHGA
eukprot:scaffold1634_cov353-Prasinococcus_capsulatus_cf.AAC.6